MESSMSNQYEAEELYVLLKKNYRISRNIRLMWFFENLFNDVNKLPRVSDVRQLDELEGPEIQILSARKNPVLNIHVEDVHPTDESKEDEGNVLNTEESEQCLLKPSTKVYFVSRAYRIVFALDLSPSMFRVDAPFFRTIAESLLSRLADCLCSLLLQFQVPGSEVPLHPNIYVTIFAQTRPTYKSKERYLQEVIVQGCLLTRLSVANILRSVEAKIYHGMRQYGEVSGWKDAQHSARHDHGLVSMLRTSLLALQLLPSNTSSGIVVITDGVVGMPDMAVLETLLNQLRSTTTSCSFLLVPNSQPIFCDFSYCANIELLKFIASATYGTWFDSDSDDENTKQGMNSYQKWLLIWRFQTGSGSESLNESLDIRSWDPETDLRYTPKQKNMFICPILRKKQFERTLRVSIFAVISVRLREGYMITSVSLSKNKSQIEIQLVFPWNHGTSIKYYATAGWPVVKSVTKVEVYVEGTYEFLYDISVGIGQDSGCRYRTIVVRRFKHFMKGLTQTDLMLTHLLSFSSDPGNYTKIQKHVPLFYLPPNSNQLVLSSGNESSNSVFSTYWKPILSLDVNIWQRWLHTHNIEILLQHDLPLPKHLHFPSKSGRYHSIQTSFAMSQLSSLLREWSTFVLLENHSYVKFIHKENEETPCSFYLIRLSNKAPMVVIRLAFLIGTTGKNRNLVLRDLRSKVLSLTFPSAVKHTPAVSQRGSGVRSRHASAQTRTRHPSAAERQCAVLIHKPLDRVLIRYDQTPRDFMQPPTSSSRHGRTNTSTRSASSTGGEVGSTAVVQDLCRYMNHHRWVWSITNRSATPISMTVAGQMASVLVKIRLSEGFNFASCSSGVISMVREFPMSLDKDSSSEESYYCTAQFIIFPPTVCTSRESFSMDGSGDEEETTEADGELFLATEMWIEPQCGTVTVPESPVASLKRSQPSRHSSGVSDSARTSRFSSTSSSATSTGVQIDIDSPQQRFAGLHYDEIPEMISKEDNALLTIMVTIEHLRLMCFSQKQYTVLPGLPQAPKVEVSQRTYENVTYDEYSYSTSDDHMENTHIEHSTTAVPQTVEGITHVPSVFNLTELLDHCPRAKLLFMTLTQNELSENNNFSPNDYLFEYYCSSLEKISDREALLSDADCSSMTDHIINRGSPAVENLEKRKTEDAGKWKCYLKTLPKAKVLVILLPASYKDLRHFSEVIPEFSKSRNELDTVLSPTNGGESNADPARAFSPLSNQEIPQIEKLPNNEIGALSREDYRLARRMSLRRLHSQQMEDQTWSSDGTRKDIQSDNKPSPAVQLSLPVFIYECSTHGLIDRMVKDPMSKPSVWSFLDIEQDHRIKSVERSDADTAQPKSAPFFRSHSHPVHSLHTPTVTNSEGFFSQEDVFSSSFSQPRILEPDVSDVCEQLVEAYHRCFVRGVANSLRMNHGNVESIDVQSATDAICQESVQEIDITQFLLITCPQVATFKNKHSIAQEFADEKDHDDVFSLDAPSHIPVARVEPMIRHTSSTSSTTTDPAQESSRGSRKPPIPPCSSQEKIAQKDEKLNNGSENQASDDDLSLGSAAPKTVANGDKSSSRSAFKKLRTRRARTPPKNGGATSGEVSDTDGDTSTSQNPPSSNKAKISVRGGIENSLPRSLKVAKPRKKIVPLSKAGWDGLPEFPLSVLKESHPRHLSGSDDQVKANFNELLRKNFHPVKSYPDFFYYDSIDTPRADSDPDDVDHPNEGDLPEIERPESESHFEPATESDTYVKFYDAEDLTEADGTFRASGFSMNDENGRASKNKKYSKAKIEVSIDDEEYFNKLSGRHNSSSDESYFDEEPADEDIDNFPLFLCMTCTVRDKKTGNHGTMPVDGLPTSLRTVLQYLENPCTHIELSQLYITLDLIWIMLPMETRDSKENSPSCDDNTTQECKFSGLLPDEDDSPQHESTLLNRAKSNICIEEQGPLDPLATLPSACLSSVNSTKENIEWLLRDEIICALRTCELITWYTLEKVAKHVEESTGNNNCMKQASSLQFVFGTEKSFRSFEAEFEKSFKDFKGYRMKKEGPYYYFTMERTFLPIPNWPVVEFFPGNDVFPATEPMLDFKTAEQSLPEQSNQSLSQNLGKEKSLTINNNEHTTLRRTKTAPVLANSPSVKPYSSMTQTICPLNASFSCQSLPSNQGTMSVDAIESDVCPQDKSAVIKQPQSSQSTPVRKTSSAIDLTTARGSSTDQKQWSPRSGSCAFPGSKGSRSRSSRLIHTDTSDPSLDQGTPPDQFGKPQKKRLPIKQKSVESNMTSMEKCPHGWRRSSHSVIPLSVRHSPQQYSGPTSPLVSRHLSTLNSSFSSASSAPLLHTYRKGSQTNTPVAQIVPATFKSGPGPNSSTPMMQIQNQSTSNNNVAIISQFSNKDPMSSPVSMSDGEYRRYSTASLFESGYDGEESDLDEDDEYMASLQDGGNDLPSFWLIALVQSDLVKLYFHRRSSAAVQEVVEKEHKRIFDTVISRIEATCKCVNQMLLLTELHESRMCNALLLEETEEDIWKHDYNIGQHLDEHGDDNNRFLLAATMTSAPGHFTCDCVLEKVINLHPRLKTTGNIPGKSSVMATVRDFVRNLMVTNRKNMFVYSLPDKSVFYCRMDEESSTSGKGDSRRSSMLNQASSSVPETGGSLTENLAITPERRNSKESLTNVGLLEVKSGGTLTLKWYGVGIPNPQQREELERMNQSIAKKLDDSVLEKITVLLQRKSKLSLADVLFIQQSNAGHPSIGRSPSNYQTRSVTPSATLSYAVPDHFSGCIPAIKYYLHQNLLQFMAIPRYSDPLQTTGHFTAYRMRAPSVEDSTLKIPTTPGNSTSAGDGSVFLFHQSIEPGKTGYGIACVVLEITDSEGKQIVPDPKMMFDSPKDPSLEQLLKMTEVLKQGSSSEESFDICDSQFGNDSGSEPKTVVRFHLWLKGSLTVDHLEGRLKPAVRHALFDCVTEFVIVQSPLCDLIPSMRNKEDELAPMESQKPRRFSRFSRKLSLPNSSLLSLHSNPPRTPYDDLSPMESFSGSSNKMQGKAYHAHAPLSRVRSTPSGKHALTSGNTNLLVCGGTFMSPDFPTSLSIAV